MIHRWSILYDERFRTVAVHWSHASKIQPAEWDQIPDNTNNTLDRYTFNTQCRLRFSLFSSSCHVMRTSSRYSGERDMTHSGATNGDSNGINIIGSLLAKQELTWIVQVYSESSSSLTVQLYSRSRFLMLPLMKRLSIFLLCVCEWDHKNCTQHRCNVTSTTSLLFGPTPG